jgi:hypothetical protein
LHSKANFVIVHLHFGAGTGNRLYQSRSDQAEANCVHVDVISAAFFAMRVF